jgi:hypothetical protein
MTWFAGVKDLLAIGIALLAVALSLITAIMQRKERQRAAYREIYTVLMSEDVHRGRWFINGIRTPDQIPKDGPNRLLIYRTLGVSTTLRCSLATVWSPENGSWTYGTIRCAICGQLRISFEHNTRPLRG